MCHKLENPLLTKFLLYAVLIERIKVFYHFLMNPIHSYTIFMWAERLTILHEEERGNANHKIAVKNETSFKFILHCVQLI